MNAERARDALALSGRRRVAAVSTLAARADAVRVELDSELAALKAEHEQREMKAEWAKPQGDIHPSGWRYGPPQCHACRRVLKGYGGWCESCRSYSYGPRDGVRCSG